MKRNTEESIWLKLEKLLKESGNRPHLKTLLKDAKRCERMSISHSGIHFDFSHQNISLNELETLLKLAEDANLGGKIKEMFGGKNINATENRPVLHVALRGVEKDNIPLNNENSSAIVLGVLNKIKKLSDEIRNGNYKLSNGKPVKFVIVVGIGGSYLGLEAVYEAFLSFVNEKQIPIRFLANVDPLAFKKATRNLTPENTLVIITSKSFTTAETMLNAKLVKKWLHDSICKDISKHLLAVSANVNKCEEFGIRSENVFPMWDCVGGRFSVTSAVGVLPLAITFGFQTCQEFLNGARNIDRHFLEAPLDENIPVLMALLGVWNANFHKYPAHAIVPYCEALNRFPAHIQQVDMESNGKSVLMDGSKIPQNFGTGEIVIGEPGTNAQHSFFQLMHQGRIVPVDFIGFRRCKNDLELADAEVSSHDELMSNFFAQADALAIGSDNKNPHRAFEGNRPSLWILFDEQTPFAVGQLIALYEHRVAAQGFLWGINSFDQFGVELGKKLGVNVRKNIKEGKKAKDKVEFGNFEGMSASASKLLRLYLD